MNDPEESRELNMTTAVVVTLVYVIIFLLIWIL